MSYAIVVFANERGGTDVEWDGSHQPFDPRCLYPVPAISRLRDARALADRLATQWPTVRYAVFDMGRGWIAPYDYDVPDSLFRALSCRLSCEPAHVPASCVDLARHYGWECEGWGGFARVVPEFTVIPRLSPPLGQGGAVPGCRCTFCEDERARERLQAPAPVAALPLNPDGPLELEDGTRLEVLRHYESGGPGYSCAGRVWHNPVYGDLLRLRHPGHSDVYARIADGVDCGLGPDLRRPRVRNVGGVLPPMPASVERFVNVAPEPVAISRPALPLDPSGPIELEDGTPCRVDPALDHAFRESECEGAIWHNRTWGDLIYLRPERGGMSAGWYVCATGCYCGDSRPVARNANASPAAEVITPDASCDTPSEPVAAPAPRFEVRSGLLGTDRDGWGTVIEFDNGKEAGAWVAANKATYAEAGKSLCIVKVEPSAVAVDWRERERQRLADGTYTPLPGDWEQEIARKFPDHFAHVASSDKRKVAFTESEGSGERDKQKVLSASAYVERFFSGWDGWLSGTRAQFVSDMLGSSLKPLLCPLGDADAMEGIYRETATNGLDVIGCMSHPAKDYSTGGIHPSRVYALGGELTVAYLRGYGEGEADGETNRYSINPDAAWDSPGPILARCLVWIKDGEPQGFGRVYGGAEHSRALRTALEAAGYRASDLDGARIGKLQTASGDYVMPYLDIGGGYVREGEDCWFAGGGEYRADQTCGLLDYCSRTECDCCNDMEPEDDMNTVYVAADETEQWCNGCRENGAYYCSHTGAYVSDAVEFVASGQRYSDYVARWLLEDGTLTGLEVRGVVYEDGAYCVDCGDGIKPDHVNTWDGRDTGNADHNEGDSLCSDCFEDREEAADALETDTDTDGAAIAA